MSYNPAFRNVIDRCIRELGRQSGPRLPIPVHPKPDEGFADLLTRAATENGYATRHQILKILIPDYKHINWNFAALSGREVDHEAVSNFLGNGGGPAEMLHLTTCPEAKVGERSFYFFGVRLSNWHVNHGRRVSPRALKNDLYLRATWNLRSLAFDPDTKELLLERCPVCKAILSDVTTKGLQYCEKCTEVMRDGSIKGIDLRCFPQPIVQQKLWSALDFATGLIDPRVEKQTASLLLVPQELACCSRATVFELICYLARNLKPIGPGSRGHRIPPEDLAVAAEAVMRWPNGFAAYVETLHDRKKLDVMTRPDKRTIIFAKKDFFDVPQPFLETIRYQLKRRWLAVAPHDAMDVEKFAAKAAHIQNDMSMLQRVSRHPAVQALIEDTGLPVAVIGNLVSASLGIDEVDFEDQASEWCGRLLWQLKSQCAQPLSPTGHFVRLDRAVGAIWHRNSDPWGDVLANICNGTLRSSRTNRLPGTVKQTYVSIGELYEVLRHKSGLSLAFDRIPLDIAEVALSLGVDLTTVSFLKGQGVLPKQTFNRDVYEMKRSFVLPKELLNRGFALSSGVLGKQVGKALGALGLEPVIADGTRRIWSRNEIEQALKGRIVPLVI